MTPPRAARRLALLLLLALPVLPARADGPDLEEAVRRLQRQTVELLRRVEALERRAEELGLPAAEPTETPAAPVPTPPAAPGVPAEGGAESNIAYGGLLFPARGRYAHAFRIEEETGSRGVALSLEQVALRKDTDQGRWLIAAYLSTRVDAFDRERGALPQQVGLSVRLRYNLRRVQGRSYDVEKAVERFVGRYAWLDEDGTVLATGQVGRARVEREANGVTGLMDVPFSMDLRSFLGILLAPDLTVRLEGQSGVNLELSDKARLALRDLASRIVPEGVGGPPRDEPPAPGPSVPPTPRAAGSCDEALASVPGGAFSGRVDKTTLREAGGGARTEAAVEAALRWLAAHQAPNGAWEAATFGAWCDGREVGPRRADGAGKAIYDPGVTGLAVLAILGAGHSPRALHPLGDAAAAGLEYLRSLQDAEGCVGPRTTQHYIYNHGVATIALVEAYGMTGKPAYRTAAQDALNFIALARNPYFAWRYGVKPGDNDTSVTGWMVEAIHAARVVNDFARRQGCDPPFVLEPLALDGALAWLEKMTDPDTGRVGYIQRGSVPARPQELLDDFPPDASESMTAVALRIRQVAGVENDQGVVMARGMRLCLEHPPRWVPGDGSIDMYYWYYGTLALRAYGGDRWRTWNRGLQDALLDNQRKDTDPCLYRGSWDPIDPWGADGGRVYATALCALCLEAYYR